MTGVFLQVVWWDVVLNVPGLRRFRRPPLVRYQAIARRYRALAGEMGGVLIKLGQFLSTRVDILPPEIRRVHIAEIFGSNFLFGVITACLLVRRLDAVAPLAIQESAY